MKPKRGFTLIEILVAVTIFSFAMIVASSIFSNIVGSQSLVTVSSEVNQEGQRIARQISDDTVSATASGTINIDTSISAKGILFLKADGSAEEPNTACISKVVPSCYYPGIVLFTSSGLKIYQFHPDKTIWYGISTVNPASNQLEFSASSPKKLDLSKYTFFQLNNKKVEIVSNGFSGISCYNSNCSQAPFIRIDMTTQTKDYGQKSARHRAKLELRTMISGRSY